MNQVVQHILSNLNEFLKHQTISFDEIFEKLHSELKYGFINLLLYLDKLLDKEFFKKDELSPFHLHFDNEFSDAEKILIAQFFLIKSFWLYNSIENHSNEPNIELKNLIKELENRLKKLEIRCPDGASGMNGGNRIWKNWMKEKKDIRSLLKFHKDLKENTSLKPTLVFNTQINFCRSIAELFKTRPYCTLIDSNYERYNILNSRLTLNDIDKINYEIIDNLKCTVLFDCERKKVMTNFSFEELNKWNSDYGTSFNQFLIITFGKEFESINNVRIKIETIRERFKIPINTSYTILKSEIDFLLNKNQKTTCSFDFVGLNTSTIWDSFILESSIRELYELRSIKLMNVYSTSYNDEIKNYILDNIFSSTDSSELVSTITKMKIIELRDDDILVLKDTLSNTLDLIIKSEIHNKIKNAITGESVLVYDELIVKNKNLLSKISRHLGLTNTSKIKSWADFEIIIGDNYLFLSYRDQGKYPNCYFPNLFEIEFIKGTKATAILPTFLFKNYLNWAQFYLLKDYYKYLTHPIRETYFHWDKLKKSIQLLKPEYKLNIDLSLENEYSNSNQRDTYKIKLKGRRENSGYGSDLFIITDEQKISFNVVRIDALLNLICEDGIVFIQNLDEIQENINIYEKIVDNKQEEEELAVIRKQFNLGEENAGRLWKVLLRNLAENIGEDELYSELKKYFETKGLKIVSQFHFKNSWINPQSESIAPLNKRVFIELCNYLNIPRAYFFIIQRIRNADKGRSRQNTIHMNQLLKDLFNDSCFDTGKNPKEIIISKLSNYKSNHPLDELGIDENYLADNLVILTELIKPELKLLELESIKKIDI